MQVRTAHGAVALPELQVHLTMRAAVIIASENGAISIGTSCRFALASHNMQPNSFKKNRCTLIICRRVS
jgi:hypothetical protein